MGNAGRGRLKKTLYTGRRQDFIEDWDEKSALSQRLLLGYRVAKTHRMSYLYW